jgi:predicted MFS family arabinose efflux permease
MLRVLAAAAFLLTFQSQLFAPLIPAFRREFLLDAQSAGSLVTLYMVSYGISTLFYGPISDRVGRRSVILVLLAGEVGIMALSACVQTFEQLRWMRIASGLCSGGVIPLILALIGDLFAFRQRGRALGLIFSACAGGSAFGSTCGALLNPSLGWRGELWVLAAANAFVLAVAFCLRHHLPAAAPRRAAAPPWPKATRDVLAGYIDLVTSARGARTYAYVFCNGFFHYGIYTWLSTYFIERYGLDDRGIGWALLGYGVMGMFLAPSIGSFVDTYGRARVIPAAFSLAAFCAALLALPLPVVAAGVIVTFLSFSYDLAYPPLVGIVTTLSPKRRGEAVGLNALMLFAGFGAGSLVFGRLMQLGAGTALTCFAVVQLSLAIAARPLFRSE